MIRKAFALAAAALACSCGGGEEAADTAQLEPSPLPVTAVVVQPDTLFQVVRATGRITAARTQQMVAQIQGVVAQAPAGEGVPVGRGEVVFRLAAGEYGAALQSALAGQRSAQALYDFECSTYQGELTDERREMLASATGLLQAEADLARARTQYGNSSMTAGFAGVVSDVQVREGVTVYPGTVLGSVVDLSTLRAEVDLDERDLALCAIGAGAFVTVPSLSDTTLRGTLESVSPVIDPATRAGRVTVSLDGVPGLRPGATAYVEIVTGVVPDMLLVPQEAILSRDGREMVFVVEQGRAAWRYVTTAGSGRGYAAVTEGVSAGEQVITGGHYSLAHDAPVAVTGE